MAKGRPLSAAHKAAISAGLKRYWASKRGDSQPTVTNVTTGRAISREEAAQIMFGTRPRRAAAGRKTRRRSR